MSMEPNNPARDEEDHRVEELMVRYWDGSLSEDELAELNAALAARPGLRAVFQDLCLQVLGIAEHSAAARAVPLALAPLRRRSRRRFLWSAAAAGVLLATGAAVMPWRLFSRRANRMIAHLSIASGIVQIGRDDTHVRPSTTNQALAAGEVVSTQGMDSSAEIRCLDGTRLILSGNTSIVMPEEGESAIRFAHGALAADVRTRPAGHPLRIVTPALEVQARAAKLALFGLDNQTVVGVFKAADEPEAGTVQLKRFSDRQLVRLRPGEWAETDRQGNLRPNTLPRVPDRLEVTFGEQLPHGWGAGKRVVDHLPPGSGAAVRAVPQPGPLGTHHAVKTQNAWTNGLFEIHDDSWFHFRFRLEKPGFFQILVVVRSQDPTRHLSVVLENNNLWKHSPPRQWHTVHAPFRDFSPTRPDVWIEKPLVAFVVVFDSQTVDRGLTIERFWITRGREGAIKPT
ncbi:MAG TPA: FecR family protein [Gemmataceae bacterium]|nr:FecR family protein [Gemmataceae bacterium]